MLHKILLPQCVAKGFLGGCFLVCVCVCVCVITVLRLRSVVACLLKKSKYEDVYLNLLSYNIIVMYYIYCACVCVCVLLLLYDYPDLQSSVN